MCVLLLYVCVCVCVCDRLPLCQGGAIDQRHRRQQQVRNCYKASRSDLKQYNNLQWGHPRHGEYDTRQTCSIAKPVHRNSRESIRYHTKGHIV